MSIVLFNPTNERFEAWHGGEALVIPAYPERGHKVKVDDARGKHILNNFGPRGLMKLEYGDEDKEEQIADQGRRINHEFKLRMVEKYNQTNQQRRNQMMSYLPPSKEIAAYAEELGEELIRPYRSETRQSAERAELLKENTELKDTIAKQGTAIEELTAKMAEFINSMRDGENVSDIKPVLNADEKAAEEIKNLKAAYKLKRRTDYHDWLSSPEGKAFYHKAPLEIQEDMRSKWEDFYSEDKDKAFPH